MKIKEVPQNIREMIFTLNQSIKALRVIEIPVIDLSSTRAEIRVKKLSELPDGKNYGSDEGRAKLQRLTGARDGLLVAAGVMSPKAILEPKWMGQVRRVEPVGSVK